jgi:hypothetical protein
MQRSIASFSETQSGSFRVLKIMGTCCSFVLIFSNTHSSWLLKKSNTHPTLVATLLAFFKGEDAYKTTLKMGGDVHGLSGGKISHKKIYHMDKHSGHFNCQKMSAQPRARAIYEFCVIQSTTSKDLW